MRHQKTHPKVFNEEIELLKSYLSMKLVFFSQKKNSKLIICFFFVSYIKLSPFFNQTRVAKHLISLIINYWLRQ